MEERTDVVNVRRRLDNKRPRRLLTGCCGSAPSHSLHSEKEVASVKLRILRGLLPVSIFVLAVLNGSGPWPPK